MTAHILLGPLDYRREILEDIAADDLVIGADVGALFLVEHDIRCDIAMGDFDSVNEADYSRIIAHACEVIEHPIRKDATDSELACDLAFARGADRIVLYGGIGGRFDHSYANVKLLERGDITIRTGRETLYVLLPGEYRIQNPHLYLSLFALDEVKHLHLREFSYELDDITLAPNDLRGISNQGSGTIEFCSGKLLVIHQSE